MVVVVVVAGAGADDAMDGYRSCTADSESSKICSVQKMDILNAWCKVKMFARTAEYDIQIQKRRKTARFAAAR